MSTPREQPKALAISQKFYERLQWLYPRRYRQEYGAPMAQLFRDQARDAWAAAKKWGLVVLWLRVLPDLMKTSVLEHIANWKGRKSMADKIAALGSRWAKFAVFGPVFATVFLLVFVGAVVITFITPKSYSSRVRVRFEPDLSNNAGLNEESAPARDFNPYLIQTEFEVIQSDVVLHRVVDTLQLGTEWGKKSAAGRPLKTQEAAALLQARLEVRPVRNASMAEIHAYSDNPAEAAQLANAVAEAYRNYRLERLHQKLASGIAGLQQQFEAQEKKIRAAQADAESLRKSLNISDADAGSDAPVPTLDPDSVRRLQGELLAFETQLAREKSQVQNLQKLNPELRRNAISTAIGPDSEFSARLTELSQAEQKLVALQNEVGTNHPTYLTAKAQINDAAKRIDVRVEGVMIGLSNRITGVEATVAAMSDKIKSSRQDDIGKAERIRPYYEAKIQLNDLTRFRSMLGLKLSSARVDASLPRSTLVEIMDLAVPDANPVRPNKQQNLFLGAGIGTILALLIGVVAAWLFSRPGQTPPRGPVAA